jgi:hypothetical protein
MSCRRKQFSEISGTKVEVMNDKNKFIYHFSYPDGSKQIRKSNYRFKSALIIDAGEGEVISLANAKPNRYMVAAFSSNEIPTSSRTMYEKYKQEIVNF